MAEEIKAYRQYIYKNGQFRKTSGGGGAEIRVVDTLPELGEPNVLYVLDDGTSQPSSMSTEYIWYNGKYQVVGDSEVVRQLRVKVVSSLPTEGSPGYIYIVPGEASSDLPEYTSADANKVLKVNNSGTDVEWGDAAPVMEGGEAIFVNDTIIDLKYDPNTQEINGSNQLTTKAVNGTDGSVIKF